MHQDELEALPDDVETLRAMVAQYAMTVADKQRVVEEHAKKIQQLELDKLLLEHRLAQLLRRHFGRSTERIADGQLLLPFAAEAQAAVNADLDEELDKPDPESSSQPRRKGGRQRLPDELPRFRTIHGLAEDERQCDCKKPMPEIGEVISEELVKIDLSMVHQIVRKKYGCNVCNCGVLTAPGPERVLPKSIAGPSMLAWVIDAKYSEHLPLYRVERILDREGIGVTRATLCNWIHGCSELLQPIAVELQRQIRTSSYVQTDDTPMPMQRGKDDRPRKGHIWVYTTPDGKVFYDFTESRARDGPLRILGEFEGIVQADAYSGYDELFRRGKAKELGCWAHTRRGFFEAKDTDAKRAGQVLAAIKKLYAIEDRAKVVAEESQRPLPDVRLELRQREAAPIIATLGEWLRTEQQQVLPKSPIGQAIGYAINQWAALLRYLDDGRLDIDNNRAERMLRPVAVGRKNHLFVFNEVTGQSATVLMSLVATCRAIGVDARLYLNDVLQEMRRSPTPDVASLTPHAWKDREDQEARRSEYRAASAQAVAEAVLAVMRK